jgi:tetratricopeptide (TPR) repeat protein
VDARAREQAADEVKARRGFAERSPDDPVALLALADAHRRIGQWDDAGAALDRAEALDGSDPRIPLARARLAHSRGESAKADEMAKRADERFETLGSPVGRAVALKLRGEIAFAAGKYDDAQRYYGEAERSCRDGGLVDLSRAIGTGIADCRLARGELGEAERLYRESISAAKRLGDSRTVVTSLGNLGGALYSSGRLDGAESVLREAIAEGRSIENPGITLGATLNLASLMAYQGRVAESKSLSESALQLARDANDDRKASLALLFLADAEFQQGLFPESLRHYDELLASQRGAGAAPRDLGNTLFARGWVLGSVGRTAEAMAALDEALELQRKLDEKIGVAYSLVIRSEVFAQWADWDAAARDLAEARKIASSLEPPNPDLDAQADLAQAGIELMRDHVAEARTILDRLRARIAGTTATQVLGEVLAASCEAMTGSGQAAEAADLARKCVESSRVMELDRLRAKVCLARAVAETDPPASSTLAASVLDQAERSGALWIAASAAALGSSDGSRVRGLKALEAYWNAAPESRRAGMKGRPDLVRVIAELAREER